jgi:hypothetical protein
MSYKEESLNFGAMYRLQYLQEPIKKRICFMWLLGPQLAQDKFISQQLNLDSQELKRKTS